MSHLLLVHHADAVGPDVDPQRPLSEVGRAQADRAAAAAARQGVSPAVIWHSGKLRARQTAEAFRRQCNPFAEFSAARHLQPADPPEWMRDQLRGDERDILIVGHFPHLPRLLQLLLGAADEAEDFPQHGGVSLVTDDQGATWHEEWRVE